MNVINLWWNLTAKLTILEIDTKLNNLQDGWQTSGTKRGKKSSGVHSDDKADSMDMFDENDQKSFNTKNSSRGGKGITVYNNYNNILVL